MSKFVSVRRTVVLIEVSQLVSWTQECVSS